MSFIPNTDGTARRMLDAVGVLLTLPSFSTMSPQEHLFPALSPRRRVSEQEVLPSWTRLPRRNADSGHAPCFLGRGRTITSSPASSISSSPDPEFATAYTPYQPEISQGTLQAIFEYQSMIARLTGMESPTPPTTTGRPPRRKR